MPQKRPLKPAAAPASPDAAPRDSTIDSTAATPNVPDWRPLFVQIKSRKSQIRYREIKALLLAAGFTEGPPTATSHRAFSKPNCFKLVVIPEGRGQLLVVYVTKALKAIEECADD